jgi:hypothetical protein
LKISIREQTSTTSKDGPDSRPERGVELRDRNVISVEVVGLEILWGGGVVFLHHDDG